MPLLDIVQTVATEVGLTSPNVAVSSTDQNILQIIACASRAGKKLAARADWQALTNEATFTTVATESQGSILTLAGPDFASVVNETMWDRSTKRPVFGPKVPAEWQQLKAQFVNGPWEQYRIRGNQVLFIPVPGAGDQIFFEWVSKYWCAAGGGTSGTQVAFATDTDISILDEDVITLDAIWRFKKLKRLAYDDDFDDAEAAIADLMSRDASKPTLNLSGPQGNIQPGVWVPAGNWGL